MKNLLPRLVTLQVSALVVSRYNSPGERDYWVVFLYVGGIRHDIGTPELRHLPLADQAEDLLRQLAEFSPRTVDDRLCELAAAVTPRHHFQFASICKMMSALPKGCVTHFLDFA